MFDFKKSDMKRNSLGTFLNYLKDVQALLSFLFYFFGGLSRSTGNWMGRFIVHVVTFVSHTFSKELKENYMRLSYFIHTVMPQDIVSEEITTSPKPSISQTVEIYLTQFRQSISYIRMDTNALFLEKELEVKVKSRFLLVRNVFLWYC